MDTQTMIQPTRTDLINGVRYLDAKDSGHTGSSFFINLTSICPVGCPHCMYASTLQPKGDRDSFVGQELEDVITFVSTSQSRKLSISGGGEPFLKFKSILRILETVSVPVVELLTSGNWATSDARVENMLGMIAIAVRNNPSKPKVSIRLSIDRFHIDAPKGVPIAAYARVARVWAKTDRSIGLGYRCLNEDWDDVDVLLAKDLDAALVDVNDWNRRIVLPDETTINITYNVLRLSGAGKSMLGKVSPKKTALDHFKSFEVKSGTLQLSNLVNDSINGNYIPTTGHSITIDADGKYWIFGATAPDRKLSFGDMSFQDSITYFLRDPLTIYLLENGVWKFAELVRDVDPELYDHVIAMNDTTFMVDELLPNEAVSVAVTKRVIQQHLRDGRAELDSASGLASFLAN